MKHVAILGHRAVGILAGTLLSVAAPTGVSFGADAAYRFTIVDIPHHVVFQGQERTDILQLTDINNWGHLVGNAFPQDGLIVRRNHTPTEIRCPGDQTETDSTTISAINNVGHVVGSCTDGVSPNQRIVGFVRDRHGNVTLLNVPGADSTFAFGINDLGHVVGQYGGFNFGQGLDRFHGFLWKDGEYTTIDALFPDAMHTALLGINITGQIIGTYLHHRPGSSDINDYDSEIAFLYADGNFLPLAFPGAKLPFLCCGATTFPMDINNLGQVVGSTYDNDGHPQWFLYEDGEYVAITGLPENVNDPQDHSVVHGPDAVGINDFGQLAGSYVERVPCDSCGIENEPGFTFVRHSFVATPETVGGAHARDILRRIVRALKHIEGVPPHLEAITGLPVR